MIGRTRQKARKTHVNFPERRGKQGESDQILGGDQLHLYGLKTCDTCRKARKSLPDATFVDVRDDGVPSAVLEAALAEFGMDLVNTRSKTWRGLSEAERDSAPMELLQAHPTLMKRPVIGAKGIDADGIEAGGLHLGWTKDVQAALLG